MSWCSVVLIIITLWFGYKQGLQHLRFINKTKKVEEHNE